MSLNTQSLSFFLCFFFVFVKNHDKNRQKQKNPTKSGVFVLTKKKKRFPLFLRKSHFCENYFQIKERPYAPFFDKQLYLNSKSRSLYYGFYINLNSKQNCAIHPLSQVFAIPVKSP